ncbi:hypothetical protein ACIQ4I_04385 [Rummeliibacillus sp. NPDC094406]|uniref:hypothetical protein n=1 Tax=Rummeliibacillus sp. NPDC094406 TaxID=3364511 RepID=UPI0038240C1C
MIMLNFLLTKHLKKRKKGKLIVFVFVGLLLLLIGLVSLIFLLVYAYKEFKEDDDEKSKKIFFLILGILDILFGTGGFALILSLGAILIGIVLIFY